MRGATKKRIDKFIDILIANTPPEQITKSRTEMVEEVKKYWKSKDKQKQEFIHHILTGK